MVTADGKVSAIYAKDGTISIASPLGIFEPAGGILDDAKQNICTFDGKVSPHAVIKQFDPTAPGMTHTVKWITDDGTVLETDTDVPYGSLPTYDGATPTKEASGGKTYMFKGWTPDVVPVSADATYTDLRRIVRGRYLRRRQRHGRQVHHHLDHRRQVRNRRIRLRRDPDPHDA